MFACETSGWIAIVEFADQTHVWLYRLISEHGHTRISVRVFTWFRRRICRLVTPPSLRAGVAARTSDILKQKTFCALLQPTKGYLPEYNFFNHVGNIAITPQPSLEYEIVRLCLNVVFAATWKSVIRVCLLCCDSGRYSRDLCYLH